MIYDMRIYDLKPGSVDDYMAAVEDVALKIREDYGVKLAGWYYTDIGPLNQVIFLLCCTTLSPAGAELSGSLFD